MLPNYFQMQFCDAFLKNITPKMNPNIFWLTILWPLQGGATTLLCMQFNFLLWKITIPGNVINLEAARSNACYHHQP